MPAWRWWAGTSKRVVVPIRQAGNRFLGSLKGLQKRALVDSEEHVSDAHQKALNFLYIVKSFVKKFFKILWDRLYV
jgi:hypothetical protein